MPELDNFKDTVNSLTMAWAGDYEDGEDDELNSTPIEEILAVTREDQEMLTEAHKALRREIKSIRKALKKLVRQFYDYADAQQDQSTAPEWSDVSSIPDTSSIIDDNSKTGQENVTKLGDEALETDNDESEVEALRNITNNSHQRQRTSSFNQDKAMIKTNDENISKQYTRLHRSDSSPMPVPENRDIVSPDFAVSRNGHGYLSRNATQTSTGMDRTMSTNSDNLGTLSPLDDEAFFESDSNQLNNTYPGRSPGSELQKRPITPKKLLGDIGRRKAKHFSESDINGVKHSRDFISTDSNDAIPPEFEQQLPDLSSDDRVKQGRPLLQRRFTQEEIRQAGSQLRIPSMQQMKRANSYKTHPLGMQGPKHQQSLQETNGSSVPPTPTPQEDTTPELHGLEDQLGMLPEFHNSFQALPRRLSNSEISAIGSHDKHFIPNMKKLIRSSTQPISVAEIAI